MRSSEICRAALVTGLVALTAGCGVTYTSPSVQQAAGAAAAQVRVMRLTPETIMVANRSAYTPRSLPEEFNQIAATGQLRGAGALPEPPFVPEERREAMELRPLPEVAPPPYRIGVGDVVILATPGGGSTVEELAGLLAAQNQRQGYTVRDDGAIAIPDIGQLQLAGLTLQEAEDAVFRALVENQIDPAFSLEVSEFNSKRIAIGGAVGAPGLIPVTLQPLSLRDALIGSGDIRVEDAQFATIRIYRDGTLYQIPVQDYRADPALQERRLLPGDAIFVDTTYDLERAFDFYQQQLDVISLRSGARQQALSELQSEINLRRAVLDERRGNFQTRLDLGAEDRDYVYLAGEVANSSRYTMPYNRKVSLADVLYDSGGFPTTTGDAANIYVLRPSNDPAEFGAVTAWHLDAANAVNLTLATRFEMRPDDIVFVEEQPITRWNRALQQFFPTLINTAVSAIE